MAKKIGIELDFNTKSAEQSAESFAKEIDKATTTLGGLEEQQDELLAKLKETEIGTAEFKQLSKELNNTKSQIKDLELGFEGLDMEQRFTAATDAIGGVAGGFAAVEGAIAIAGVESAEFEETMLRVQGAMALAMGIKDISTAVAALNKLNVAAKLAAAGQKVLNFVMSANPIGLIVVAIGALVAGFIAFSDKIKSVVMPILQPLIDAFDFVADAVEGVAANLGIIPSKAERAAAAQKKAADKARQAVVAEERKKTDAVIQAEQEKRQARSDAYDFEIAKLQAAGQATFDVEQEKLGYVLDSLANQKKLLQGQIDFEKKELEKSAGDSVEIWTKSGKQEFNAYQEVSQYRIDQKQKELEQIEEASKNAAQLRELNQIREDKKRNDAAKAAAAERAKQQEEERKKREEDEKAHADRMLQIDKELADKRAQLNKDARAKTREEINAEREEDVIEMGNFWATVAKNTAEATDERNQDDLEKEQQVADAKMLIQESIVKGGLALTELLVKDQQKAEKIQKAFALAQIAIDTAKAISSLTANAEGNPLNAPTGGLAGIAQFAAGIARILTNMASAAALLKKPSPNVSNLSSSAGGGVAGAGVPINAVQNGSTLIGNGQPDREVNKVVVVESDITSTQNSISQIQSQATVVE